MILRLHFIFFSKKLFYTFTTSTVHMDLVNEWMATLSPREKELHAFAAIQLKAEKGEKGDSGSYFPEKSRAFLAWLKKRKDTKV